MILSLRPTLDHYIDGRFGDYLPGFVMTRNGKPGVEYKVGAWLEVSERPYIPARRGKRK